MKYGSQELIEEFLSTKMYGDILDFLIKKDISSHQAITILRLYEKLTACEGYFRFLSHPAWADKFSSELMASTKIKNRWIREIRTCQDENLEKIMNTILR